MAKGQPIKASVKVKVALEAVKGQQTVSAIASKYGVHPTQVSVWKQQLLKGAESVFDDKRSAKEKTVNDSELFEQIGRLKMELEWLKKKSTL